MRSLVVVVMLAAPSAFAFPWMVKHNYGSCAACHVDPSGAGQLTPYGRAQADVLVRFKTSKPPPDREEEVPPSANFLWFLALPDWVNLSGNFRGGALVRPGRATPAVPVLMAADLYATFTVDRFVFHGTGGFGLLRVAAPTNPRESSNLGAKALVAPACDPAGAECGAAFLAREFWVGARFADETVMVRAGRLNLPFGLRNNEHNSWVRETTRTDVNQDQQVGVSFSYNTETLRAELMGIAGNFQLGPDRFRERGYSAYGEYALAPNAYLGVSSLITHANADLSTDAETTRHAHGLFARVGLGERVALLGEADFLAWTSPPALDRFGFAAWVQADVEVFQGLHLMASVEAAHRGGGQPGPSLGGWLSASWYFLPHLELRVDNILRRQNSTTSAEYTLLAMLHFYL